MQEDPTGGVSDGSVSTDRRVRRRTRRHRWVAASAAAAATVPLLVVGCSKNDTAATTAATTPAAPEATSTTSPAQINQGPTVGMVDFRFEPDASTAKAGQAVTWVNNSATNIHQVVQEVPEAQRIFGSATPINPGQSYVFTFTAPGEYKYICAIHKSMKGTITIS